MWLYYNIYLQYNNKFKWYREKIILIIKIKVRNIFKNMFKENENLKFQDV